MAGENRLHGMGLRTGRWLATLAVTIILAVGCSAPRAAEEVALPVAVAPGATAPLPPRVAPVNPAAALSEPASLAGPAALAGPAVAAVLPTVTPPSPYNVLGIAPELTNETWLNSQPLRLADLRGKVVLIDFWTYG